MIDANYFAGQCGASRPGIALAIAVFSLAFISGAPPAPAQDLIPNADPQAMLQAASAHGKTWLRQDDYGDPQIVGNIGGQGYRIDFYGCTDNRDCTSVTFSTVFSGGLGNVKKLAAWNRQKRFGKAYIDVDGRPVLEMSATLAGGVTAEHLADLMDWWHLVLGEFAAELAS